MRKVKWRQRLPSLQSRAPCKCVFRDGNTGFPLAWPASCHQVGKSIASIGKRTTEISLRGNKKWEKILLYPHFSVPGMTAHYYCYVSWKMQKCQQGMKWGKSRRTEEYKVQCFSYNIFVSPQWLQWVSLNGKIEKKQACPEIRAPLIYVMKSYTR